MCSVAGYSSRARDALSHTHSRKVEVHKLAAHKDTYFSCVREVTSCAFWFTSIAKLQWWQLQLLQYEIDLGEECNKKEERREEEALSLLYSFAFVCAKLDTVQQWYTVTMVTTERERYLPFTVFFETHSVDIANDRVCTSVRSKYTDTRRDTHFKALHLQHLPFHQSSTCLLARESFSWHRVRW